MSAFKAAAFAAAFLSASFAQALEQAASKPFTRFYGSLGMMLNTHQSAEGGISNRTKFLSLNASIGRWFSPKTRVAIRVDDRQNEFTTEFVLPYNFTQTFDSKGLAVSLEGYRTLWKRGNLSVNLGAGLGVERSKFTQTYDYGSGIDPFNYKYKLKRLRVNGSIGVSYNLAPRLALQADYRLHRITGDGHQSDSVNRTQHGFTLALTMFVAPQALPIDIGQSHEKTVEHHAAGRGHAANQQR